MRKSNFGAFNFHHSRQQRRVLKELSSKLSSVADLLRKEQESRISGSWVALFWKKLMCPS